MERYFLHSAQHNLTEVSDLEYTPVIGFQQHDFEYRRWGHMFIGEIKVRHDRDFNYTEGSLIEVKKYNALMKLHRETGKTPVYLCFWKNGQVTIQNLLRYPNPELVLMPCPKDTANGGAYIEKECYLLSFFRGTEVEQYDKPDMEVIREKFKRKYVQQ
ncbi:hypothetical protein [Solirubrum puertoriconensis]|uniref:hypothetical protein n=1 Tax=Solirubrum puertoriconensis TaxID=1751427 RepID=UPI00122E59C3|nr:hypothetical protein [Solirubrum puertoriconensis]